MPIATHRPWPATVINGSTDVDAKYASLNAASHRRFIGSSPTTDGFDAALIEERYAQLTSGVRRQQLLVGPASIVGVLVPPGSV